MAIATARFRVLNSTISNYSRTFWSSTRRLNDIQPVTIPVTGEISIDPIRVKQEDENYEKGIRLKILNAALPFVHDYGWSQKAISAGAETLGYPGIIHGLFPRGGADLVQYFYTNCNEKLVIELKKKPAIKDRESALVAKRLEEAMEIRLRMLIPYKSKWPQALALMALPKNVPLSLANLLTLADDLCYYAGDRSVDFSWYSRRIGISAIYKMTELYLVQDQSEDHRATWEFLSERIAEAIILNSMLKQTGTVSNQAKETVSSAITMARNILGSAWR